MLEKIIIYVVGIFFVVFIIGLINLDEYMKREYRKNYKEYFKTRYFGPTINSITLIFELFSSKLTKVTEKNKKLKRILIICRTSFMILLALIITYFSVRK